MNPSWKTSVGGSLAALGTTLTGIGSIQALNGNHTKVIWWTIYAGVVLSALGQFFNGIFARDRDVTSEAQGLIKH